MKKFVGFLVILFAVSFIGMAQDSVVVAPATEIVAATDSTIVDVPVITGGTVAEFLKTNMWVLIFIVYSLVEAWFGQTQWIKEGSVLAFIWNWIGRIIKKQLPTVKARFMTQEQIKAVRGGK